MSRWYTRVAYLLMLILLIGCKNQTLEETTNQPNPNAIEILESEELLPVEYQGLGVEMIHINQTGYRPTDRKVAIINSQKYILENFDVMNMDTSEIVYAGQLKGKSSSDGTAGEPILDSSSGDFVYKADFSDVTAPGMYAIVVPEYGSSYPFLIQENVYKDVKNALLKNLYYQRCGIELKEEHAGVYTHGQCHIEMALLYEDQDQEVNVSGGWHDAGDYGRYVAPGANAVAFLLLAYELFPNSYEETINIPESGNGVPDLLNEARYELDWLLRMQDLHSGGVYHKVTGRGFEDFIMPEFDHAPLLVMPISPTATADLAGIMAMASRIYNAYDNAFSITALTAAEQAWAWLEANPNAAGYKNPADVVTGEYGDSDAKDETFWAAVELFKTTGKAKYHDYVKANYKLQSKLGLGWLDMSGFGTLSYLFMNAPQQDATVHEELKSALINEANRLVSKAKQDGYEIPLSGAEYEWGSNMTVMNKATLLIAAHELQPNSEFEETAESLFHYLLGRNALDQSYVSGFGSKPMMNPHHRPSSSDSVPEPIPGLVSGGPNRNKQDPTAEQFLRTVQFPARSYIDHQGSWSTNETTIYWNAPAIFVAGYLDR